MSKPILILGASGYIGSALAVEASKRSLTWMPLRTSMLRRAKFHNLLRDYQPALVINAAAFIPRSGVSACDGLRFDTYNANTVMPAMLTMACICHEVPLLHISTACLFDEQREYQEEDTPTRGFNGHCGTYVGSKLLAEEAVMDWHQHYILRIRLPFDGHIHNRNYLTKLSQFNQVYEHTNCLTHREDFAKLVFDLWRMRAPYGTYHCVNPGTISARSLVDRMYRKGILGHIPEFVAGQGTGAILSTAKLAAAGLAMRPLEEALTESLTCISLSLSAEPAATPTC